jgi:hypothetical protein
MNRSPLIKEKPIPKLKQESLKSRLHTGRSREQEFRSFQKGQDSGETSESLTSDSSPTALNELTKAALKGVSQPAGFSKSLSTHSLSFVNLRLEFLR